MATKLTQAQEHVLALASDKKDLYADCERLGDYGGRRQTVNALRKRKLIWSDGTLTETGKLLAKGACDKPTTSSVPGKSAKKAAPRKEHAS